MLNLLFRLAGLLLFSAGVACVRALPVVVGWAWAQGPAAGAWAGTALFLACALAAGVLLLLCVPLMLAGLYAMLFRLKF